MSAPAAHPIRLLIVDDSPLIRAGLRAVLEAHDEVTIVGEAGTAAYFFIGLFTFTTYLLAGWAREQVCTYMCPWPRFQASMLDEQSLIVTYQGWRGEPRGHRIGGIGREAEFQQRDRRHVETGGARAAVH